MTKVNTLLYLNKSQVIAGKQGVCTQQCPFFVDCKHFTICNLNTRYMLNITQISSFKMDRKMSNGTVKPSSRRYVYLVTGDATELATYKRDTLAKTNPGGMVADNGDLRFYSWRKVLGGSANLLRSSKGSWFIDTESIDDMESLAEQSPALMKAMASELLNRLMGDAAKPEPKQQEQDADDDEDELF